MSHFDDPWTCAPIWNVPDPCILVTLPGGLELKAARGKGVEFSLSSWDGWTNGPDVRGGSESWENADGGVRGDVFLSGLNLVFEGMIRGRSANHLWELQAELGSVLTRARWGSLRVDEDHLGLSRQVEVARGGRPTITPVTRTVARYAVQFQSHSHLKLGVDAQSATLTTGGVALQNIGNANAPLTVRLAGPLTNPGLSWPGGAWTYGGSVPSGTTLQVDMARRVVRDPATTAHSRNLAAGSWLSLPPGSTTVQRTGSGAGSIRAEWRSAWS